MKMTKRIAAMAACAVMTVTSMVGMGANATMINSGRITYTYVPFIEQTTTTNCSATTLLEMMYGLGLQDEVSGTTDKQKIDTLWNELAEYDEYGNKSVFVYKFSEYLNKFGNYRYTHAGKTNLSDNYDLEGKIHMSLWYDKPVAIRCKTENLGYYNGVSLTHYIAVSQSDALYHTFTVVDCNYDEAYGGYHYDIPLDDLYDCTTYVIYGS